MLLMIDQNFFFYFKDRGNVEKAEEIVEVTAGHNETKERRNEIYPCAREDDRNSTGDKEEIANDENANDEDSSSGHNEQNGTEEWRDEGYSCDKEDEAADRNSSNADEDVNDDETATGTWRKTRPGPKKFEVTIKNMNLEKNKAM